MKKAQILYLCLLLVTPMIFGGKSISSEIVTQEDAQRICPEVCKNRGGWKEGAEHKRWGWCLDKTTHFLKRLPGKYCYCNDDTYAPGAGACGNK
jgi:hypothetical protein